MENYFKYLWIFVLEELMGNIGVQAEKELYQQELEFNHPKQL